MCALAEGDKRDGNDGFCEYLSVCDLTGGECRVVIRSEGTNQFDLMDRQKYLRSDICSHIVPQEIFSLCPFSFFFFILTFSIP